MHSESLLLARHLARGAKFSMGKGLLSGSTLFLTRRYVSHDSQSMCSLFHMDGNLHEWPCCAWKMPKYRSDLSTGTPSDDPQMTGGGDMVMQLDSSRNSSYRCQAVKM